MYVIVGCCYIIVQAMITVFKGESNFIVSMEREGRGERAREGSYE